MSFSTLVIRAGVWDVDCSRPVGELNTWFLKFSNMFAKKKKLDRRKILDSQKKERKIKFLFPRNPITYQVDH